MLRHEYFEELCALAVTGDIREDEWATLNEHLECCAGCRQLARSFEDVCLLVTEAADHQAHVPVPAGMTQRFIARARSAGIPLNHHQSEPRPHFAELGVVFRYRKLWAVGGILALAILSFLVGLRYGSQNQTSSNTDTAPSSHAATSADQAREEDERLRSRLIAAQEQATAASLQLKQQQMALESAKRERATLSLRVAELERTNTALRDAGSQGIEEIARLRQDLDKARSRENISRTTSLLSEAELRKAQNEIANLRSQLSQAQEFTFALSEARDLIVDRNVHVLTVLPEVDQNGKQQRARGRIFYAEGKKLVFYAYDLTDPTKISAKASFYLWGETLGSVQRVVGLGNFQIDNEQDGRWVLRVTDPHLLAQINSVFVTAEPDKRTITQPTGRRMLSRLLDANANHQ